MFSKIYRPVYSGRHCFGTLCCGVVLALSIVGASAQEVVDPPSWNDGLFPTVQDSIYLNDKDRSDWRARTGYDVVGHGGYSGRPYYGLEPYGADGYYHANQADSLSESSSGGGWSGGDVSLHGQLPWVTKGFYPDESTLKAGPLYFDLVSMEAGVLYSDYDGDRAFLDGDEDGFLSFVGLRAQALLELGPSLMIVSKFDLIYLPGENRVGFRFGNNGSPLLRLDYRREWGVWDVNIYDELGLYSPYIAGDGAIERAGRYQFGFVDAGRSNEFLSDPILANRVGARGMRPLGDWNFSLGAEHANFWGLDDDTDYENTRQRGYARLDYAGDEIPFSPYNELQCDFIG